MNTISKEVNKINSLIQKRSFDKAEKACRKLLKKNADNENFAILLINILISSGKQNKLESTLRAINRIFPANNKIHITLSSIFRQNGLYKLALIEYQTILSVANNNITLYLEAASLLFHLRFYKKAISLLEEVKVKFATSSDILLMLGAAHHALQELNPALTYYDKAYKLSNDNTDAITGIANIYFLQRDNRKALSYLQPLMSNTPPVSAIVLYIQVCIAEKKFDEAEKISIKTLQSNKLSQKQRSMLLFSLGKINDAQYNYKSAFMHYKQANNLENAVFNKNNIFLYFEKIKATFNKETIKSLQIKSEMSSRIIFIVGMPRSGTSLTEQILSAHPEIYGAGELNTLITISNDSKYFLNNYRFPENIPKLAKEKLIDMSKKYLGHLNSIDNNSRFITDKMPDNFIYLGLINILFPRAKIIHCSRNPLDTCLSCYFQQFSGDYSYSYNLENLGHYYNMYLDLMHHWGKTLTLPVHNISYEKLVANKNTEIRKLIEFCNLDWNDRCLDFNNSERTVTTASSHQVNKSLYNTSVNRWENYSTFIQPLTKILTQ